MTFLPRKAVDAEGWATGADMDVVRKPTVPSDPDGPPVHGFNVRLNEYELGLVREVAKLQRRSRTSAIKGILVPALERALAELRAARAGARGVP